MRGNKRQRAHYAVKPAVDRRPTTCSQLNEDTDGRPLVSTGTLGETFGSNDDDNARQKFGGRQIVLQAWSEAWQEAWPEAWPENHE